MKLPKICLGPPPVNLNIHLTHFPMEKFSASEHVSAVLSLFDLELALNYKVMEFIDYKVMEFIDYVLFSRYSSNICDCETVGTYV